MDTTTRTATDPPIRRWEDLTVDEAGAILEVERAVGLSRSDAADRLAAHGENRLASTPPQSKWLLFADQFRGVLVIVLAIAAVIAGLIGDVKDTIVIAVVLVLNATMGFIQENRAADSLAALRSMLTPVTKVRRDGEIIEVDATDLVTGDVVLLETGDRVPADGRIAKIVNAEVDESSLTGESTPVAKTAGRLDETDAGLSARRPVGDRHNLLHMNTVVTRGRIEMLVTATAMDTEMGRVAALLEGDDEQQTPLQAQLDELGKRLALLAGIGVGIFFALGLIRGQGLGDTLINAVALAVAAIPEGLPAVVTVTLAVGVAQMARRNAIVKRLSSVETLGSTSVICSDKTGTLTQNVMTPVDVFAAGHRYTIEADGYRPGRVTANGDNGDPGDPGDLGDVGDLGDLGRAAALCSDARVRDGALIGDPTEGALVSLAASVGVDVEAVRSEHRRVAEVPFDATIKLMATFNETPDAADGLLVVVKGALDRVLDRCGGGAGLAASKAYEEMERLAAEGRRVIAIATGRVSETGVRACGEDPDRLLSLAADLELLGIVGIVDPPRPEAHDAIRIAHRAGIDVKMITGDHPVTASSIATTLGIRGRAVTGVELDALDDAALAKQIGEIGVFARVAPEHKLRIIRALQSRGDVVAMTGDGVNDAPALRRADVGVAMGITGTEVSKDAADVILTDDDFTTIVRAVEAGRTVYTNIVTFVRFQLSTGLGAVTTLLAAQVAGLPVPFTALQMLWVNIIMDGPPAMTMGVDPPRRATMTDRPRPRSTPILTIRRLRVLLLNGAVMAAGTLGVLAVADSNGRLDHALTLCFTTFVLFQFFNALAARSEHETVFRHDTLRNAKLWIALATVLILQVGAVHFGPLQRLFGVVSLTWVDWIVAISVASSLLWVNELRTLIGRFRSHRIPVVPGAVTAEGVSDRPAHQPA